MRHPDWQLWYNAATAKMQAHINNGTQELVQLPSDCEAIGFKWVFILKQEQRESVTGTEKLSPVHRMSEGNAIINCTVTNLSPVNRMSEGNARDPPCALVTECMHDAPIMGQLHKPLQKTKGEVGKSDNKSNIKIKGVFSVNTYCCCNGRLRVVKRRRVSTNDIELTICKQECRGR